MLGLQVDPLRGESGGALASVWNEAERAKLRATIENREPFLDYVFHRVGPDGNQQSFQVSGEPMFNSSSRFVGYRGIGVQLPAKQ